MQLEPRRVGYSPTLAAKRDRSEQVESGDAPWPGGCGGRFRQGVGDVLKLWGGSKALGTATPTLPGLAGWPRSRRPPGRAGAVRACPVLLCSVLWSYLTLSLRSFCDPALPFQPRAQSGAPREAVAEHVPLRCLPSLSALPQRPHPLAGARTPPHLSGAEPMALH